MNRLKKIFAILVCLAMMLTSITVPAIANDMETVEATNVALGKSSTASRASAGIAPYTDLAKITDGVYFANNSQNQYITYGPSLIAITSTSEISTLAFFKQKSIIGRILSL